MQGGSRFFGPRSNGMVGCVAADTVALSVYVAVDVSVGVSVDGRGTTGGVAADTVALPGLLSHDVNATGSHPGSHPADALPVIVTQECENEKKRLREDDSDVDSTTLTMKKDAIENFINRHRAEFNVLGSEDALQDWLEDNLCDWEGMSLVAKEWEPVEGRPDLGKGDLVFRLDGEQMAYFVVEVKHLNTGGSFFPELNRLLLVFQSSALGHFYSPSLNRYRKDRKVKKQALRYSEDWKKIASDICACLRFGIVVASEDVPVFACTFTNLEGFQVVKKL